MSTDCDCLFVHVPKFSSEYLPLGEYMNVTYMPMGLLAIADRAARAGYAVEVLHLGVEWMVDPGYSLAEELAGREVRAVGLPLHWHYQAFDVIEVCRAIRKAAPETFIFLGGFTAGYFAEEILDAFPFVDGVVLGDGELAIVPLLRELSRPRPDLGSVPGLLFRSEGGALIHPGEVAQAGREDLDELRFAELSLLRHHEVYVRSFGFPLAFSKEYGREENAAHQTMGRTFFPLCVGRGCPVVCSYCGGNRRAQQRLRGRREVLWRAPERVLADIRRAVEAGYRTMSLCFDPYPTRDGYYLELFGRLRAERLPVDFYFECWGLPTRRFLEAFAETFGREHSYLAVSPDSGNEAVRRANKAYAYSNEELWEFLKAAERLGVQVDVFFTLALPGETVAQVADTRVLMERIREGIGVARRVMIWTVQIEPGSPQYEQPERFGIVTDRRSFQDYYRVHGSDEGDTYVSLGYKIPGYFGDARDRGGIPEFEAEIQHLKCMEFCFLSPDPRQAAGPDAGREHCLERRRRLARRRGVDKEQRLIGDDHRYAAAKRDLRDGLPAAARPVLS